MGETRPRIREEDENTVRSRGQNERNVRAVALVGICMPVERRGGERKGNGTRERKRGKYGGKGREIGEERDTYRFRWQNGNRDIGDGDSRRKQGSERSTAVWHRCV